MNEFWGKLDNTEGISTIILFIIGVVSLIIVMRQIFRVPPTYRIKLIALYIFLILLQLSMGYNYFFNPSKLNPKHNYIDISAYIFIIFEYIILICLIVINIKSKFVKNLLFISSFFFVLVAVFNWYFFKTFAEAISITTAVEGIPLILACLYFFYELLQNPPTLRLNKEPSFWIATGILFLFVCILPFYLTFGYFKKIPEMQIVDYVGYAIIIILFTKASLCKEKEVV